MCILLSKISLYIIHLNECTFGQEYVSLERIRNKNNIIIILVLYIQNTCYFCQIPMIQNKNIEYEIFICIYIIYNI